MDAVPVSRMRPRPLNDLAISSSLASLLVITGLLIASAVTIGWVVQRDATAEGPLEVTDDRGHVVSFPARPLRIVSIAPSTTEIVCAVGLCDRLVALDQNSNYPPEVADVELRIYGYKFLDKEGFRLAAPDVVFASTTNEPDLPVLEGELGLKVVVLGASTLDDVMDDLRLVGRLGGVEDAADHLVEGLEARIAAVDQAVATVTERPKVYHEIDGYGGFWTFGPGSFGDELITRAGGTNIAHAAPSAYPSLTSEEIVAADPAIITYSYTDQWGGSDPEVIKDRPGWGQIEAVETGQIHRVNDDLISRPGPRLVDGLEAFARLLHPAAFE